MTCTHCPFAFTDESEYVQELGCLPSPWDIIKMKRKSDHNWACHSNEKVICSGFVEFVKEYPSYKYADLDMGVGGLISYESWYQEGEEEAIRKANESQILLGGKEKMKHILELVRWNSMGLGEAEQFAKHISTNNDFFPVDYSIIDNLFQYKNIPLKAIWGHEYYIYYNYHSSSGHHTVLYVNDKGKIDFKVENPVGGVLCAFTAEIVIFTLADKR